MKDTHVYVSMLFVFNIAFCKEKECKSFWDSFFIAFLGTPKIPLLLDLFETKPLLLCAADSTKTLIPTRGLHSDIFVRPQVDEI